MTPQLDQVEFCKAISMVRKSFSKENKYVDELFESEDNAILYRVAFLEPIISRVHHSLVELEKQEIWEWSILVMLSKEFKYFDGSNWLRHVKLPVS